MKIVVGLGDRYGNAFWRLIVPYSHLGSEHEVIFTDTVDMTLFCEADLLVFQRVSTPVMLDLLKELRQRGKVIIQDFDDNIHTMNPDNEAQKVYSNGKIATRIFEQSLPLTNLVTCSTKRLVADYQKFGGTYMVCENFIPTEIFDRLAPERITGAPKHEGTIRVGYAGSSSHGMDLALVAKPLRKICEKYPQVQLVIFGQTPDAFDWRLRQKVEYHGYIDPTPTEMPTEFMARYHARLRSLGLDVAIAPLQSTTFNLGKSFLKCLEYGGCGWPIVASNCGPYRDYKARGGQIYTVDEDRAWIWALSALIENFEGRRELAERNHAFVRDNHTTAAVAPWFRAIETAVSGLTVSA
jgi:glycosyltransferase involved in cell wall biosynthesis